MTFLYQSVSRHQAGSEGAISVPAVPVIVGSLLSLLIVSSVIYFVGNPVFVCESKVLLKKKSVLTAFGGARFQLICNCARPNLEYYLTDTRLGALVDDPLMYKAQCLDKLVATSIFLQDILTSSVLFAFFMSSTP